MLNKCQNYLALQGKNVVSFEKFLESTNLAKFLLICVSNCLFAWKFSRHSKFGYFGKKDGIVFWKKFQQFSKNAFFGKSLCRMRLKWYYCSRNIETFKLWVFREKLMVFLRKTPRKFSRELKKPIFSRLRLRLSYCLRALKMFKVLVFWEKRWNVLKKFLQFSEHAFSGKLFR